MSKRFLIALALLLLPGPVFAQQKVNTELPDPVTLTDALGNPIVPQVGAHTLIFDGSVWKRLTFGTAGTASTQVLTVQGIAGGVALPVSPSSGGTTGSSVPASANYLGLNVGGTLRGATGASLGSTFAQHMAIVDGSGNQITTFGGGTQYTSGAVQATPTGTAALGSDGSNVYVLRTNSSGNLEVSCSNCSGSGASSTDNSAFTFGTTTGAGAMFVFDDTSPNAATENRIAVGRMSGNRVPYSQLRDAAGNERGANVNASNELLVALSSTPLPTGAATAAKQPALGVAGTASTDVITVQGIASGVALPVSGTITCTNCSGTGVSVNEDVASANADPGTPAYAVRKASPANTSGADGDYEALQMSAGRLWTSATIDAALPAGSNVIGAVTQSGTWNITNAGTFAVQSTLQTGTNSIGDVRSVTTSIIPGTSATHLGKAIDAAAGATDTGVALLGIRDDALTTLTPADGDYVTPRMDSVGRMWVNCGTGCSGGTQFAEDLAHTTADVGTVALAVRRDTAAAGSGTDGDYSTVNVDANGRMWTNIFGVTQAAATYLTVRLSDGSSFLTPGTDYTFDAALTPSTTAGPMMMGRGSSTAPTAASASDDATMLWVDLNGRVQTNTSQINGVAPSMGNGASGTGVQRVTIANDSTGQVALAAGSATIGSLAANQSVNVAQINGVTPLMGAGNTGTGSPRVTISTDQAALPGLAVYVEDAGETAAGNLAMVGSVRRDTAASSAGTTGDNATLNTNASGALWVSHVDPCSSEAKITAPFSLTARGVVIAAAASKKNYICGIVVVAGAAEIFNLVEGTGTTCQTSTAAIVGSTTAANGLSFAVNGGMSVNAGNSTVIAGTGTNVDTCIMPSGSNRLSGFVTYVQR